MRFTRIVSVLGALTALLVPVFVQASEGAHLDGGPGHRLRHLDAHGAGAASPHRGSRRIELEPFVRYGQITTTNLPESFLIPESWDREQYVTALLVRPGSALELKVEYLFLRERSGESADGQAGVRDDQLVVQLRMAVELL